MRARLFYCVLLFAVGAAGAQDRPPTTYDVVASGTQCTQSQVPYQNSAQLNCVYTVGTGLKFSIAGVGQADAAILVDWAAGLDSDFYFKFGVQHGCVIVARGFGKQRKPSGGLPGFDMVFVSPKTGRVYRTWEECGSAAHE